jgi:hypothetical protein
MGVGQRARRTRSVKAEVSVRHSRWLPGNVFATRDDVEDSEESKLKCRQKEAGPCREPNERTMDILMKLVVVDDWGLVLGFWGQNSKSEATVVPNFRVAPPPEGWFLVP